MILRFLLLFTKNKKPFVVDKNYMYRWFIIPKNRFFNIYFHKFVGSDAPTPHDHPWISAGIILQGSYIEHTPKGIFKRTSGQWTLRMPSSLHWIEIYQPVYTLFITGPKIRRWGFQCKNKWVDYQEYIDARGDNRLADGCGED